MTKKNIEKTNKIDKKAFQQDLISWFEQEQRQLPWRKDRDPYKIWVSEIMLQQTRVDTVIPYFNRFIEQFPTIAALAEADEERVLKAWEGLGYYSRARNLQSAVREVRDEYGGKVPDTLKGISSLKGVGPYTAGAILSIAYGVAEPAVDGNVMRVISRILTIWEDIARPAARKVFEQVVRQLISKDNPSYFNQALMELGALICTPSSPSCLLCPVREHCQAFHEGVQQELPVKTKKQKQKHAQLAAAILTNQEGQLLIHKRPDSGLLATLWEFPNTEINITIKNEKHQLVQFLKNEYDADVIIDHGIGRIEHVFSHLIWNISVYTGTLLGAVKENQQLKFVSLEELKEFAFPVPHQKMLRKYLEQIKKTP